jgi:hypothetical protein
MKLAGYKPATIKSGVTSHYKNIYKWAYNDGDLSTVRDIEDMLITLRLGYGPSVFRKWLQEDED